MLNIAADQCPLCERDHVILNEHHLIPIHKGGRKGEKIMICTNCHDQIHSVFTNNELRDEFNSLEKLKEAERMLGFYKFINKRNYSSHLKVKQSIIRRNKR